VNWSGSEGRFSQRAERLLVRVLLALRREARTSDDRVRDQRRAEELADVILSDFPRRVIPLGMAAVAVILVVCSMPLLRDMFAAHRASGQAERSAVLIVESGLRTHGAEVGDGIDALRSVVAPFASEAAPSEPAPSDEVRTVPPSDAAAPYKKS